jgi:choline dehydrogenase-like flavoprotein
MAAQPARRHPHLDRHWLSCARASSPKSHDRPAVNARRVIIEDGRALDVEVESAGATQRVRGRRVTLSAGAIHSPAILMRSGIGPGDELATLGIECQINLPGVGRNLSDHPMVFVVATPLAGISHVFELFDPGLAPGVALDLPVPKLVGLSAPLPPR